MNIRAYLLAVLLLCVQLFPTISSADVTWPTTHPAGAIYKQLKYSSSNIFDAYFWWEGGYLWQEVIPVSTGPFVCTESYKIVQNGIQNDLRAYTQNNNIFCGALLVPTVLKMVFREGGPNSNLDSTVFYEGTTLTAIAIPKANTPPPPLSQFVYVNVSGSGTVKSNPTGIDCGTKCAAAYPIGTTLTLAATPTGGATFKSWSGPCQPSGTTCSLTVDAAKTITATFQQGTIPWPTTHPAGAIYKQLKYSSSNIFDAYFWWEGGYLWQEVIPVSTGPFVCTESYKIVQNGIQNDLRAYTQNNNIFCGALLVPTVLKMVFREGGPNSNLDSTVFYEGTTLTAIAIPKANTPPPPQNYTLNVTNGGNGTITSSPAGINCGSTCAANFASGTTVTLNATPATGFVFAGWQGACSGTGPCEVSMSAAKTVSGSFSAAPPQTQALTVTNGGNGMVTSNPGGITCGSTCTANFATGTAVTLNAAPAAGYRLSGWQGACSGTGTCVVNMTSAKAVTATFVAGQFQNFTLSVVNGGNGTITSNPDGINCGSNCFADFASGTVVTLSPSPANGYLFAGWQGACSGLGTCVVNMDTPKAVTATFALAKSQRFMTVTKSGLGTVNDTTGRIDCGNTCSANFNKGTRIVLTVTPAEGYTFKRWSGACSGKKACTVKLTANRKAKAIFMPSK